MGRQCFPDLCDGSEEVPTLEDGVDFIIKGAVFNPKQKVPPYIINGYE